jgi:hypothetical protein
MNLGFCQPADQLTSFLIQTIVDDESLLRDWPIMNSVISRDNDRLIDMKEFKVNIRLCAITALFHLNTTESIAFLKDLRGDAELDPLSQKAIDFNFEMVNKYGILVNYAKISSEGIVE